MQEAPRVPEPQVTPMTPMKTTEPEKELSPEAERTNSYQHYVMSGKGDTPEQKVNKVVKELNYHNMLVVIAVGDKPSITLEVFIWWLRNGGSHTVSFRGLYQA